MSEHGSPAPGYRAPPFWFGGGRGDRSGDRWRDDRHEVWTREFTHVQATRRCNTLRPAFFVFKIVYVAYKVSREFPGSYLAMALTRAQTKTDRNGTL